MYLCSVSAQTNCRCATSTSVIITLIRITYSIIWRRDRDFGPGVVACGGTKVMVSFGRVVAMLLMVYLRTNLCRARSTGGCLQPRNLVPGRLRLQRELGTSTRAVRGAHPGHSKCNPWGQQS